MPGGGGGVETAFGSQAPAALVWPSAITRGWLMAFPNDKPSDLVYHHLLCRPNFTAPQRCI